MSLSGEPLRFGFKRTFKSHDAVKREKTPPVAREFISHFGQDDAAPRELQELVIPKQANRFRPGGGSAFVPRFVPTVITTKEQLASQERFEAAQETSQTQEEVQYGLQPRPGALFESTASEFVSENDKAETESLEAFRAEVQGLPDEADAAAYERMPVEVFGLAMLKGMDWKEGQVLGKNKDRKAVEAIEFVPRASRLGLGAAPNAAKKKKRGPAMVLPTGADGKVRHVRKLDEKLVPYEEAGLQPGDKREIVAGEHKGFPCIIVQPPSEEGEVLVRLPNEEEVQVQLAELGVADRIPDDPITKRKKRRIEETPSTSDVDAKASWLMTGIRVRIVDKRFDKGQSYLKKGVVVDIVRPGVANLLLDKSQLLKESVKASSLETVVPRHEGTTVVIVQGQFRGSKARLLQRISESGLVTVQLLSELSVHQYSFDEVSEYVRP